MSSSIIASIVVILILAGALVMIIYDRLKWDSGSRSYWPRRDRSRDEDILRDAGIFMIEDEYKFKEFDCL